MRLQRSTGTAPRDIAAGSLCVPFERVFAGWSFSPLLKADLPRTMAGYLTQAQGKLVEKPRLTVLRTTPLQVTHRSAGAKGSVALPAGNGEAG